MNGQQLRNSILKLAIQGKLVPQDSSDEPASVLLSRIREEKQRLVDEKIIKKEKPLAPITEEEKPFDIPESWEWVRLGEICIDFIVPQRDKPTSFGGNIPWCRIEDIEGKYLNGSKSNQLVTESLAKQMNMHLCPIGTVICACSASIGNQAITTVQCYTNQTFIGLVCSCGLFNEYLYYFMSSQKDNLKKIGKGTTISYISRKKFEDYLFPLPPLAEQHRIVTKIEELLPLVEEYDEAQKKLDKLNDGLPEKLKKSVLQQAIMGRLGTQNDKDEPASELLKRIKDEKAKLIKEKKIKKEKVLAPITDDEKPFDIPESWEWVRLGEIASLYIGKTPERGNTAFWSDNDYPWISISDMTEYGHVKTTKECISKKASALCFRRISPMGSLIMSFKLTVGRTSILDIDAFHNEAIVTIERFCDDNNFIRDYLFYLLPLLSNMGDSKDAIKGKTLNSTSLNNLIIPLPPLAEQHRIVAKIEELLTMIERMKLK